MNDNLFLIVLILLFLCAAVYESSIAESAKEELAQVKIELNQCLLANEDPLNPEYLLPLE